MSTACQTDRSTECCVRWRWSRAGWTKLHLVRKFTAVGGETMCDREFPPDDAPAGVQYGPAGLVTCQQCLERADD